jgi:hypothetical protein
MPTTTTTPAATKTTASPATAKAAKPPKPLPAPNSDFYYLYETLPAQELAIVKRVREFMETKVAPVITDYWVKDQFPFDLLPAVKELGIGGLAMKGYGCAGGSLALLGFFQFWVCTSASLWALSISMDRKSRSRSGYRRWRALKRSAASD